MNRRARLKKVFVAATAYTFLTAFTVLTLGFLLSPERGQPQPTWIHVTSLGSLPADGTPQRLPLFVENRDAWVRYSDRQVGHVYLRRVPDSGVVTAFQPYHDSRMKIPITYDEKTCLFRSVCWEVRFDLEGKCLDRMEDLQPVRVRVQGDAVFVESTAGLRQGSTSGS